MYEIPPEERERVMERFTETDPHFWRGKDPEGEWTEWKQFDPAHPNPQEEPDG